MLLSFKRNKNKLHKVQIILQTNCL